MSNSDERAHEGSEQTAPVPRVAFENLADGQKEIIVEHGGQDYRLRVTRNGKLILNK